MVESAKELFKNIIFDLCLGALVLCFVTLILIASEFLLLFKGFEAYVLYMHCSPAYSIALLGVVIDYVDSLHEPYVLEMVYYMSGSLLFLASTVLQGMEIKSKTPSESIALVVFHLFIALILGVAGALACKERYFKK